MSTLNTLQIAELAEHLENAELQAFEVTKITSDFPDMDYQDAFDIQWAIRRRKEARGTKIVGMKMGLTSWAKNEPDGRCPALLRLFGRRFQRARRRRDCV